MTPPTLGSLPCAHQVVGAVGDVSVEVEQTAAHLLPRGGRRRAAQAERRQGPRPALLLSPSDPQGDRLLRQTGARRRVKLADCEGGVTVEGGGGSRTERTLYSLYLIRLSARTQCNPCSSSPGTGYPPQFTPSPFHPNFSSNPADHTLAPAIPGHPPVRQKGPHGVPQRRLLLQHEVDQGPAARVVGVPPEGRTQPQHALLEVAQKEEN